MAEGMVFLPDGLPYKCNELMLVLFMPAGAAPVGLSKMKI